VMGLLLFCSASLFCGFVSLLISLVVLRVCVSSLVLLFCCVCLVCG